MTLSTRSSLPADGEITLNVGKDDWPLPIPLTKAGGKWYFDGAAGKEEILYRRIGRNELAAINVCQGVVTAQKDYAAAGHDGKPAGSYAARVVSAPGKQDGLYWEVKEGESPSPAGPMLANAVDEGYAQLTSNSQPTPYHGYFYRMLQKPRGLRVYCPPGGISCEWRDRRHRQRGRRDLREGYGRKHFQGRPGDQGI